MEKEILEITERMFKTLGGEISVEDFEIAKCIVALRKLIKKPVIIKRKPYKSYYYSEQGRLFYEYSMHDFIDEIK